MFISHQAKRLVIRPGLWRLGMAGCSLWIRLCTYMVIAHTLGVQNFGILLLVQWTATLLLPVIGIGMTPLTASRIVDLQSGESRYTLAGIFHLRWRQQCWRTLLYCVLYAPLACVVSLLTHGKVPLALFLVAGIAAIPLLLSSVVTTTLQALRHHTLLTALRLFSTLLNVCLVYIVIRGHGSIIGLLLLVPAFTSILTLIVALVYLARLLPLHEVAEPGPLLRERIEQSQRPALLSFVVDTVVWRELLFLLLLFATQHALVTFGFYVLSVLLCTHLIEGIPALFVSCWLPIISRLFSPRQSMSPYNAFVKTSCSLALFAGTLCMLISICCPLIISFCFGQAYLPMVTPLRILLLGTAFSSIATVSLTYLMHNKHQQEQTWLSIGVAVLHVGLALPCILLWGIVGAALASTVAHITATLGTTWLCHRLLSQQ